MDSLRFALRGRRNAVVRYIVGSIFLAAGLGGVTAYYRLSVVRRFQNAPDPAAAHTQVLKYLRALEASNKDAIVRLAPADYAPDADAMARIERFGGASADKALIDISTDLAPDHASVRINTLGRDGRQLAWVENLFWEGGVWWLVLGGRASAVPTSDTRR